MLENKFSSLPVVRNNKIIGILTKTDLVKNLLKSKKNVGKFYTKNPIMTNSGNTLVSARKLMLDKKIHRLLVLDRGMLAGILTERDIAKGLKTFRKAIDKFPQADIQRLFVEQIMTKDPITIGPETTIGEAAKIMLTNKISGIPVISPEFGILTKTDLVRGIADGFLP
jgi:CBS domain-containing protein